MHRSPSRIARSEASMSADTPDVPAGSGQHPIVLVAISANDLAASTAFYSRLFGWQTQSIAPDLTACDAADGPGILLSANMPDGFPGVVPFVAVSEVEATLARVAAAGGAVEHAPWQLPDGRTVARFKDASATIYGLTSGVAAATLPRLLPPFGSNPKPAAGTICSLEMYAGDRDAAARFFHDSFGWSASATLPGYMAFDPGAGIGGVFQSHTPTMPAVAYVYVPNVAAMLDRVDAAGGKRTAEAMTVPGLACFGYFTDPSGTNIGLIGD
jgi:predicted enzyme related to lactoylglutathione lyase